MTEFRKHFFEDRMFRWIVFGVAAVLNVLNFRIALIGDYMLMLITAIPTAGLYCICDGFRIMKGGVLVCAGIAQFVADFMSAMAAIFIGLGFLIRIVIVAGSYVGGGLFFLYLGYLMPGICVPLIYLANRKKYRAAEAEECPVEDGQTNAPDHGEPMAEYIA
ncbi:MAG: hypothetical protein PUC98_08355 [Clostridiales bacterium]|nr:hypothetical protein [Clostridiales bacterium]